MDKTKTIQISDIGEIITGNTPPRKNPEYYGDYMLFIKPTDILKDVKYTYNPEECYSEIGYEKYKKTLIPQGATCVVTIGSIGEKLTKAHTDCFINQAMNAVIPNEKYDEDYIYYVLKYNLKQLKMFDSGTASGRENVSKSAFSSINVDILTKKDNQIKVGKILSNYDDLIENNNKRIKILEEMAQKIYKEWFVDFKFPNHETATFKQTELGEIPSDWELIELQKILSLQHGYAFKSSQFSDNKTNKILVRMGNFQSYGGVQFEDNTKYLVDGEQYQEKYVLNAKDLVMVLSDVTREGRIIGNVGFIPEDDNIYLLNQRVARINTIEKYKLYLMLLFNSKIFKNHCLSRADSATVLNLSNDDIYDYRISLPNDSILSKFNQIISPILKEMAIIISKNQTLKQTRDLLLPRLISGEIDVENMEIK